MFTIDGKHRLKQGTRLVERVVSPYTNGTFSSDPSVTVMHFTYGATARSSAEWFRSSKNNRKASAHIVIGRDGQIFQCVDFDTGANHAGKSRWRGRAGLNRWSFGIELANWGYLEKRGGSWTSYTGKTISDAVEAVHKNGNPNGSITPIGWEPYPDVQIEAAIGIVQALADRYGPQEIIGHDDIAPTRKWDPGPAFDMSGFRERVSDDLSDNSDSLLLTQTPGDTLNLRRGAGMHHDAFFEIPHGTTLQPLEQDRNWIMVHVLDGAGAIARTGWVYGPLTIPV